MNKIEVCLTPELIHQFELEGKIVVVVDIFRATSCMVAGMATGVKAIHPVAEVNECVSLGADGKIMAGERGGIKVEGFDIGNSPFDYMSDQCCGKEVAVTTTNGTLAIVKSIGAEEILIGAFLNLSAIQKHIAQSKKDVIVHCAGWKGTVNLEDTLFAGALINALEKTHSIEGDPGIIAKSLYDHHKNDLTKATQASSHAQRLSNFGVEKDLEFCMKQDEFDVVPIFENGSISNFN
ncbi:MAG: 2-phosphosulfolactate phosphatase [Cyclobacteriaceae bacterium]